MRSSATSSRGARWCLERRLGDARAEAAQTPIAETPVDPTDIHLSNVVSAGGSTGIATPTAGAAAAAMAAAAPAAVIEEEEEEAEEEGEDDEEYYRRLAWIKFYIKEGETEKALELGWDGDDAFLQEEIEDEAALDDEAAQRAAEAATAAETPAAPPGAAEASGGAALAEPSLQLAAAGEVYQKWEEVMANWLKGNFSQSAGFNRDIYAERYFAPGCTLDLSETTLARVYTGPEGASDWLEYKEDFEFGPAPFDGVGGANASEVHQKLPGGGYCTWTIRGGMVHGFVAKPSAGVGSWPAPLRGSAADSRRRSSATAGGTLYRC